MTDSENQRATGLVGVTSPYPTVAIVTFGELVAQSVGADGAVDADSEKRRQ